MSPVEMPGAIRAATAASVAAARGPPPHRLDLDGDPGARWPMRRLCGWPVVIQYLFDLAAC
jgi:hypothetical protein